MTKIEQESEVTDALKDIGIEPPDSNNANPIDFKTALAKVNQITYQNFQLQQTWLTTETDLETGLGFLAVSLANYYRGWWQLQNRNISTIQPPKQGCTTNNGKSQLAILGESIEGQDSTDPVARKYDKNQFGTFFDPPKTTLDVYKSILKDVFNEFLTNFNNSIKNKLF